jgi:hypothetical protein
VQLQECDRRSIKKVRGDRNPTNFGYSNTINYINSCSEQPTTTPDKNRSETPDFQDGTDRAKIETIGKLRQLGLSDEQIADVLGLALEVVKQID